MPIIAFIIFCIIAWFAQNDENRRKKKKAIEDAKLAQPFVEPVDEPGSAKFEEDEEVFKKAGLFGKGILIGHSPKTGKELRYNGDAMLTTIAPVGSGKGIAQIIPNCLSLDDRSLIVFCPKGETPAVVGHHRQSLGPCHLVDPYKPPELEAAYRGLHRSKYSPMAILMDPKEPALNFNSNAGKIAEGCTFRETEVNGESEFFNSSSRNLTHGVIMGVARHEPPDKRHLVRVAEIISTGEIFDWAKKIISITNDPYIKAKLGRIATAGKDDRTMGGVLATAATHLNFVNEDTVANCLMGSDFRFRTFRDRVSTALITVPVSEMGNGGRFFRLLMSSMLSDLLRPGRPKVRTVIIVDECFALGSLASLETAIGIARGFGVQIWTIWQDLSQVECRYPRTWQTFLSNSGVRTFMTPQDEKTADYVSGQCGMRVVITTTPSMSYRQGWPDVSWGKHISREPLLLPHQAREIPADRMLVFVRGVGTILSRRVAYFKTRLGRKASANPFYHRTGFFRKFFGR